MRVVVIGATGNVGSSLMRVLARDERVTSLTGVARRLPLEPPGPLPVTAYREVDIVSDPLDVLEGADVVVHLAWLIQPNRDEAVLRRTNIDGTSRVLDAVGRYGVPALVCASSVGTYAPARKDRRESEAWPATGVPSSTYSRHKATVEAMLDRFEADHPRTRVVRMRTSLVFQAAAASEIHRLFLGRLLPWHLPRALRFVPGLDALRFQATHADDIADAYARAVTTRASGAFNIAAEPVLTPQVIADAVGGRVLPVPRAVLRAVVRAAYAFRIEPCEVGWLDMALETPIMDTARARRELGWTESRTSVEALRELLDGIGRGDGAATAPLAPRGLPIAEPDERAAPAAGR